ncbi:MAG: hypothetical protein UY23_C0001G0269 [Candidatus Jorgensenbacteria bacterium GW2011_GWA1_48_11]|uniref:Endonuclease/exonuclease/phosphatase domain-containing protein n=1 Tax=Candidatus Jorgensenbacteria bacterium GW2011_GWA1_48_11 TaxID=1618660 RepID=A0A0G1WMV6_9BACT|nr:MAG: hypothetical protein UY23_C0001G0269 [Candidatus Jorgensenbacteria bacterium GW2011_GWA1_48_11]KKW12155.1 MAG: hypothetical protein UY51_C0005G0397 [Candidatus Jorgensenbacteria bacterium GW2011_GWB1_49_9]
MELKLLTFNIWDVPLHLSLNRHERAHRIGGYLKKWTPDIICLQEAFDVEHRRRIREDVGNHDYNIIEEYDETRRTLLFKRFDLTGGLVILSRYPIKESLFTPFKRPLRMTLPERIGRKGFLKALIETPAGPLLVVNTHLCSPGLWTNHRMRIFQIKQLLEDLGGSNNVPIILAGDLNEDLALGGEDFFQLIKNAGFDDGAEFFGQAEKPTRRSENVYDDKWYGNGDGSHRLDYILLRNPKNNFKFSDYRVLSQPREITLSDHEPVLATLRA